MKRLLISLAIVPCLAAGDLKDAAQRRLGEYHERLGGTFRQTWLAASELTLKDGVGEYEAYVLSSAYLYAYINGCSSVRTLEDQGVRWVAETLVGEPPGDPGPPIFIDKTTGATSSPDKITVTDLKTYLEFAQR